VKACAQCNNVKKSEDDTYLRDVLVTDMACAAKPAAQAILLGEANRALRRNQSTFARHALATMRRVRFQTPSGLYLGKGYTADIDLKRMHRIFAKITRGLFFKQLHEPLPREILFTTMRVDPDTVTRMMKTPGLKWSLPPRLGDVFACVYCLGEHENYDTLWLMGFYDQFCIAVRTGKVLAMAPVSPWEGEKVIWAVSDPLVIPVPDARKNLMPGERPDCR
jgi:hypothetical protein